MYLFINTSDKAACLVAVIGAASGMRAKACVSAKQKSSELLLSLVARVLREGAVDKKDVRGIIVAQGPGSFTSLRIGVVAANALAFGLRIPIAGVSPAVSIDKAFKMIDTGLLFEKQIILPRYGSEPNIGTTGGVA